MMYNAGMKKYNPNIAVIITTYKRQKLLKRLLDSIAINSGELLLVLKVWAITRHEIYETA